MVHLKKNRLFNLALLLIGVLFAQDSRAQDYTRWGLPDGALVRLGKGGIVGGDRAVAYSPDGTRIAVASSMVSGSTMLAPGQNSPCSQDIRMMSIRWRFPLMEQHWQVAVGTGQ